jgi:hypothetical protein
MTCCINDIGFAPHNQDLSTGIDAIQDGEHTAILFFQGIRIFRKFPGVIGEELIVPRPFNESYLYKLQIQQPDGELISVNECVDFKFKIYIAADIVCPVPDCIEENQFYF